MEKNSKHKLDLIRMKCGGSQFSVACLHCVNARINERDKLLEFLKRLVEPMQDRDDYFEAWQNEARELLRELEL